MRTFLVTLALASTTSNTKGYDEDPAKDGWARIARTLKGS